MGDGQAARFLVSQEKRFLQPEQTDGLQKMCCLVVCHSPQKACFQDRFGLGVGFWVFFLIPEEQGGFPGDRMVPSVV